MTHETDHYGRPMFDDPVKEAARREKIKQESMKWAEEQKSIAAKKLFDFYTKLLTGNRARISPSVRKVKTFNAFRNENEKSLNTKSTQGKYKSVLSLPLPPPTEMTPNPFMETSKNKHGKPVLSARIPTQTTKKVSAPSTVRPLGPIAEQKKPDLRKSIELTLNKVNTPKSRTLGGQTGNLGTTAFGGLNSGLGAGNYSEDADDKDGGGSISGAAGQIGATEDAVGNDITEADPGDSYTNNGANVGPTSTTLGGARSSSGSLNGGGVGAQIIDAADADADENDGDGDGDGDSGTVICSELHRQGLISTRIFQADWRFGKMIDRDILVGYHLWANPIVILMRRSQVITHAVKWLALPMIEEIANRQIQYRSRSIYRKIGLNLGLKICLLLGKAKRFSQTLELYSKFNNSNHRSCP